MAKKKKMLEITFSLTPYTEKNLAETRISPSTTKRSEDGARSDTQHQYITSPSL